ncbi:MAG: M15 family metallopeptidase [Humidesulfovibrio sp.]|nr:M15 family metallopeptidase [Humidesulfovibrio sp.]
MKKYLRLLALAAFALCLFAGRLEASGLLSPKDLPPEARLDLAVLRAAYPDVVSGMAHGADGRLALVLADGERLVYDDGKVRTPEEAETNPDIRTMLAQVYPLGPADAASSRPAKDFDPGRRRVQAFFTALYGHSEAEVRRDCENVRFDGHGALFSKRHGAAAALSRVGERLAALRPAHPEWRKVLRPFGGTLSWRVIAGTQRLSMHSFGIALDLDPRLPYWRTERHPETIPARVQAFPAEIVAAFEAEGFIWGGKWAAFDLMHFEYRPELVLKAKALRGEIRLGE